MTVGKLLEIRRMLSSTHLKSSAFTIEALDICEGIPQRFILHGRGWGHGVGMCQIGAASMAAQGYDFWLATQKWAPAQDGLPIARWRRAGPSSAASSPTVPPGQWCSARAEHWWEPSAMARPSHVSFPAAAENLLWATG